MHFLLVEDNDDHAFLITRAFAARSDVTVTHLAAGDLALKYLRREPPYVDAPPPDVALIDLNLPRVSGVELLRAVKSDPLLATMPVIVLTTSRADPDRARAYAAGANSYLVKPLEFDELSALVDMICRYWVDCNAHLPAAVSGEMNRERRAAG